MFFAARLAVCALIASPAIASSPLAAHRLRVNGLDAPLAVLAAPVTFSWQLLAPGGGGGAPAATRALAQASFRLQVSLLALNFSSSSSLVCDEAAASPDPSSAAACAAQLGSPALAGAQLLWRVCVEASAAPPAACTGAGAPFSAAAPFGLALAAAQWPAAGWVAAPPAAQPALSRPVRMRAAVSAPGAPVSRAVLYVASPAYYVASSNNARIDAPRASAVTTHTVFGRRVYYDAFDVTTAFLAGGAAGAVFGLRVGGGPWAAAKFAAAHGASALPVRAAVAFTDAATGAVLMAPALQWRTAPDAVTATDWYDGEVVDNRLLAAFSGWDAAGFDDAAWFAAVPSSGGLANAVLEPQAQPPVSLIGGAPLAPASVSALPAAGTFVFSFAQNFAGHVELDVPVSAADRGVTVLLYAGERIFTNNGSVWNQLNYGTNMTLSVTLAGVAPLETARLEFPFWSFQHVEVSGWPAGAAAPTPANMRGYATSTLRRIADIAFAGIEPSADIAAAFAQQQQQQRQQQHLPAAPASLSTPLLLDARILAGVVHAAAWSQLSNYQSLPSDCPNREKRGWMGGEDFPVSMRTATRASLHQTPPTCAFPTQMPP
jgi:alpha-L-rhamnosidase